MSIWEFLNSQVGLVVVGFVLTSIAGALVGRALQDRTWRRQTRVELFRKRYEEGCELLNDLSTLIGERTYTLHRLLRAVGENDEKAIARAREENDKVVLRWNVNRWNNRNKIRLLIGDPQANAFLDVRDNPYPESPASIHYLFVKTNRYVCEASEGRIGIDPAEHELLVLNEYCARFLEALTTEFAARASALELLEDPDQAPATIPGSAARQAIRGMGQIIDTSTMKLWPTRKRTGRRRRWSRPRTAETRA